MKSICLHLVAFSLVSIGLQAQELPKTKSSPWGWGVFAGVTLNHPLAGTQFPIHSKPFFGAQAGVDVAYRTGRQTSLHGQPSLARISNLTIDQQGMGAMYDLTILKIPLSYRYYVLPNQHTLFIEGGAGYNQIVKSNYREREDVVCIVGPCPPWLGPEVTPLTKVAVSGIAGVGIDIPVNKITIPILVRYERYISDYLFPKWYGEQDKSLKFQTLSLTTGVNF